MLNRTAVSCVWIKGKTALRSDISEFLYGLWKFDQASTGAQEGINRKIRTNDSGNKFGVVPNFQHLIRPLGCWRIWPLYFSVLSSRGERSTVYKTRENITRKSIQYSFVEGVLKCVYSELAYLFQLNQLKLAFFALLVGILIFLGIWRTNYNLDNVLRVESTGVLASESNGQYMSRKNRWPGLSRMQSVGDLLGFGTRSHDCWRR